MKDIVSVIIPIYNVRDYLETCIDSVRRQTYADLQIILVDDGSTDGSEALCDEAAMLDERITVIHRENGGLSVARNTGLDAAVGDYICFLDGDDWYNEEFVEKLHEISQGKSADIAVCGYSRVQSEEEAKQVAVRECHEELTEYDNISAVGEAIGERRIKTVAWNKLYNKELWANIRFPEGVLHEDEYVTYKLLWEASKVAETTDELYYYRKRADSVTETKNPVIRRKRAFDILDAQKEMSKFFETRESSLYGTAYVHYMDCLKYVIRSELITERADKKEVIKRYTAGASKIWKVPHISLYKRIALTAWILLIRLL